MKTLISATVLFSVTISAIAFFPGGRAGTSGTAGDGHRTKRASDPPLAASADRRLAPPAVDVVFVLDTTSSMSAMIDTAKEKIWSIASTMASARTSPDIRIGLIAYRDRGDSYETLTIDLSHDLDSVYAQLMDFRAEGGGDGPEGVNKALYEAVNAMSWRQHSGSYQSIFLVGDAPPHMDYQNDTLYTETISDATSKGIIVNTIQCGSSQGTGKFWKHMAQLGEGRYFQVAQSGGAVMIETPFDQELASLAAKLDSSRLYYGDSETRARMEKKKAATGKLHAEASVASQARRSVFNASDAGKKNRLGEMELLEDVASGEIELETLEDEQLPQLLRQLAPQQRRETLQSMTEERRRLQNRIESLSREREAYIEKTVSSEEARDSLESKLYEAVRQQGLKAGLVYERGPAY